jgi:hypothetical protein
LIYKSHLDAYHETLWQRETIHPPPSSVSAPRIVQRSKPALYRLLEGYELAEELQHSVWDFAVEIECLRELGITNNELRWLVCTGLARHAREISPVAEENRAFVPAAGRLTFLTAACFVLTELGVTFIRNLGPPDRREQASEVKFTSEYPAIISATPYWDNDRQELRLGYVVVKRFRVPAPNQVMILAAFQEDGWPARIDDPLPPRYEIDPKRRLHDTVNSLNRSQKNSLMHFQGDGSGCGVCWNLS